MSWEHESIQLKEADDDFVIETHKLEIHISKTRYRISNGTANELFYLEDDENRYVLRKRNSKYSEEIQLEYELEYLQHLASKDFPVPVPIKTKEGKRHFTFASDKYQLYPYIEGEGYDFDSMDELRESAQFLARLHNALDDFHPKVQKNIPRMDDPVAVLRVLDGFIKTAPKMSECEEKTISYLKDELSSLSEEFGDDIYYRLPQTVIHGDYHPANVKFSKGRICGLFDFDWISLQPRISDVVDGSMYFASKRDRPLNGTLSAEERAVMPLFMKARLINNRVDALRKIPVEKALDMLTTGIEDKLRWVDINIDILKNRR